MAVKRYQAALKLNSRLVEAHYNLSQVFKHSHSTEIVQQGVANLSAARDLGGERVEKFRKQEKKRTNRYLMDRAFPRQRYLRSLFQQKKHSELMEALWYGGVRWFPYKIAPFVGVGGAILLWFLLPLGGRYFRARRCRG